MRIVNFAKKEKKVFGNELSEKVRNVIRTTYVSFKWEPNEIRDFLIDEGKVEDISLENLTKYCKWLKRLYVIDTILWCASIIGIIVWCAFKCFHIGAEAGFERALHSDVYKEVAKQSRIHQLEVIRQGFLEDGKGVTKIDFTNGDTEYMISTFQAEVPEEWHGNV